MIDYSINKLERFRQDRQVLPLIKKLVNQTEGTSFEIPTHLLEESEIPFLIQGKVSDDKNLICCLIFNFYFETAINQLSKMVEEFHPWGLYVVIFGNINYGIKERIISSFKGKVNQTILIDIDELDIRLQKFPDLQEKLVEMVNDSNELDKKLRTGQKRDNEGISEQGPKFTGAHFNAGQNDSSSVQSMRLSQVARKLNIEKNTIIEFLESQGFKIDDNPNFKIDVEQQDLLSKEFGNSAFDIEEAKNLSIGRKNEDNDFENGIKTTTTSGSNEKLRDILSVIENRRVILSDYVQDGENILSSFLKKNSWQIPDSENNKILIDTLIRGDLIILKTTNINEDEISLIVRAVGIVISPSKENSSVGVKWLEIDVAIPIPNSENYFKPLVWLKEKELKHVIEGISGKSTDHFNEFTDLINSITVKIPLSIPSIMDSGEFKKLIESKINSNSKFWWLNTKINFEEQVNLDNDYFIYAEIPDDSNTNQISITKGDIVVSSNPKRREINGFFEYLGTNDKEGFRRHRGIYGLKEKISYDELSKTQSFGKLLDNYKNGSLHELGINYFNEIINTTELADSSSLDDNNDWKESPPEIDELYEDDSQIEDSNDSIPFHLDQVENTDRLNREPVAKSICGLLNKQIFSTSLEKSIWKKLLIKILGWLNVHKINWMFFVFSEWVKTNIEVIKKEKESRYAFMIHLQGAWGDGKSTFLNLIESNLDTDERKWIVIKFNAWQHQHITPPWWSFLDQIFIQSLSQLTWYKSFILWLKESRRRLVNMKTIYNLFTFSIVILVGFLIIHFYPSITEFYISDTEKELSIGEKLINLSKVLAAIGTLGGLIYAGARFIAKPLLLKSPQSAKSFMQQVADPMITVKKHFEALVSNIEVSGYRLAIFIDDLDRCNSKFAVELLEGIQTLYKERKVLYIVAGDKNWISECFENHYTDFSNVAIEPGQKLGYLFLEKAFQLSIRLPQITGKVKDKYWQFILDPNNSTNVAKDKEVETKEKPDRSPEETQELKVKFKQRFNKQEYSSPEQIESITEELGVTDTEATDMGLEIMNEDAVDVKHRLLNHSELIEANPRSIKRLANQYNVYRDILFAERREFDPDKLFRWLIIQNVYPLYADFVEKDSKVYEKTNLPEELAGLKDNLHWQKLVMDSKKEKGGKLMIEDIEQFNGAEKEKPTS